jgi:hypothetical protein
VLARLELNGLRHRNPPDSPYKPGEWLAGTHLHVYTEGYDARIAYELRDVPRWTAPNLTDGIPALESFMVYCTITRWPPIQTSI